MKKTLFNMARRHVLHAVTAATVGLSLALGSASAFAALDQSHAGFDTLLKKHVSWNAQGTSSSVNYKGFASDRAGLKTVIEQYAAVTKPEYDAMKRDEKLAYLVNVYNANTIELILTKYPDLKSIKDIGGLFGKPWNVKFVNLFGQSHHLDHVEHDLIRGAGNFDEPRVHFVVNCASIGCPALRPEAITGAKLDAQLEDNTKRFLRDKTRNRFNVQDAKLEVSKIFDWFKVDWTRGTKGITSREVFFAKYADLLTDDAAGQALIKDGKASIGHLEYDWSLNGK